MNPTGLIAGETYIVSVKYRGSKLKNEAAPVPSIIHYDFFTEVNGSVVAQDSNGIDLVPKGSSLLALNTLSDDESDENSLLNGF